MAAWLVGWAGLASRAPANAEASEHASRFQNASAIERGEQPPTRLRIFRSWRTTFAITMPNAWGQSDAMLRLLNGGKKPRSRSVSPGCRPLRRSHSDSPIRLDRDGRPQTQGHDRDRRRSRSRDRDRDRRRRSRSRDHSRDRSRDHRRHRSDRDRRDRPRDDRDRDRDRRRRRSSRDDGSSDSEREQRKKRKHRRSPSEVQ